MSSLKQKIQKSYNRFAQLYKSKTRMQTGNQNNLLRYLKLVDINFESGKYLDVGCGTGTLLHSLSREGDTDSTYYGIDFSKEMIDIASQNNKSSCNFLVSDAEYLPFRKNVFDGVLSNSVLHWLNDSETNKTPFPAIENIYKVLVPGGFFATSISGHGTARKFQRSFKEVIDAIREQKYFKPEKFREDPIGSMTLVEAVDLIQRAGFTVLKAFIKYEPIEYPNSIDYVTDVKAYGYEAYLSSIEESYKEEVWKKIESNFIQHEKKSYVHDQYIVYVIAKK